jgi:hypothetical protein
MLNKEPLPYLLPIHIIIDLGNGVGGRVYSLGMERGEVTEMRGKLTWALVEDGQVVFFGDRGGIDD